MEPSAIDGASSIPYQLFPFATTWATIESGFSLVRLPPRLRTDPPLSTLTASLLPENFNSPLPPSRKDPHNTIELSKIVGFVHRLSTHRGKINTTPQLLIAFEKAAHEMAARVKTADEFITCSKQMLRVCYPLDRLVYSVDAGKGNLATVRSSYFRSTAQSTLATISSPPPLFSTRPAQIMQKAWSSANFTGPIPPEAIPVGLMPAKQALPGKTVDLSDTSDAAGGGACTLSPPSPALPAEREPH